MSAVEAFSAELAQLGFAPELREPGFVAFDYVVEVGGHVGETVKIAIQVPPDWPMSPPSGPFVSPRLLPINPSTGRGRPWDAVHEAQGRGISDPEGVWEYWSRPYTAWPSTDRTVRDYLRHLRTLFAEIPAPAKQSDSDGVAA